MEAGDRTLLVRRMPSELSNDDKTDFLKLFGAKTVRVMEGKGPLRNSCFAVFADEQAAATALKRLHQLKILHSKLIVSFSSEQHSKHHPHEVKDEPVVINDDKSKITKDIEKKSAEEKLSRMSVEEKLSCISMELGVKYPLNPSLKYSYPAPNGQIIGNIAHCLASVPKFYIQVLHLMNKMNLPVPFGQMTPTPPNLVMPQPPTEPLPPPPPPPEAEEEISSSEESELEYDQDELEKRLTSGGAVKRKVKTAGRRRQKIPKITPVPTKKTQETVLPSEIFEQSDHNVLAQKKIEIRYGAHTAPAASTVIAPADLLSLVQDRPIGEAIGGFGKIEAMDTTQFADKDTDGWDDDFITLDKLRKGRLSSSQKKDMSAFRNYERGEPFERLYVKNLARSVTEKDLHFIFGRFIDWEEQDKSESYIMMLKGRMKGQAFIIFPDTQSAVLACQETNGYILKSKPMVVQFSRPNKDKA